MTNLLPSEQIKKNITEYHFRFAGTALAMLGITIFLATVFLSPSYFLASHKRAVIQNDPLWQNDKDDVASRERQKEFEDVIKETNMVLDILGTTNNKFYVSGDVVAKIIGYKTTPITISGIFYDASDVGDALSIKGIEVNRQGLISFTDMLKKDPSFASVDLPISNLVKDRDISFSISIKLKSTALPVTNEGEDSTSQGEE